MSCHITGVRVQGALGGAGACAGVRPSSKAQPDVCGVRLHLRREQGEHAQARGVGENLTGKCSTHRFNI